MNYASDHGSDYASDGDGYGWSGHGVGGSGDDDGVSGLGGMGDLQLPGGGTIPFPDLTVPGGGAIPGLPPSGPSGPPAPTYQPPQVQLQTGAPAEWIEGVPNALTLVGAVGLLFGAVLLLKK